MNGFEYNILTKMLITTTLDKLYIFYSRLINILLAASNILFLDNFFCKAIWELLRDI